MAMLPKDFAHVKDVRARPILRSRWHTSSPILRTQENFLSEGG